MDEGAEVTAVGALDQELSLRLYRINRIASIVELAIRWGCLVLIAYLGYLCVSKLAGKTTFADIGLEFLSKVEISEAAAWIFGTGGLVYGLGERRLRRNTTERLAGRIAEFERRRDPDRRNNTT
jgi:hypothetical protein